MSELPTIDYHEVATSLATDIGNLKFQLAQMENLATKLRNERDSYKARLDEMTQSEGNTDLDEEGSK